MAKGSGKKQPRPAAPKGKSQPVLPGSLVPGAGKQIAPKSVLSLHANALDDDHSHPVWRLSLLDREHSGNWSWKIDESTLGTIVDLLIQMEKLTWKQIRTQTAATTKKVRARHHSQAVDTLCKEAQNRLVELGLDGWDELFRFRLDGPGRLWGILSRESPRVFYPIWWDDEHQVYPLGKD
jgi:hypothetical protein